MINKIKILTIYLTCTLLQQNLFSSDENEYLSQINWHAISAEDFQQIVMNNDGEVSINENTLVDGNISANNNLNLLIPVRITLLGNNRIKFKDLIIKPTKQLSVVKDIYPENYSSIINLYEETKQFVELLEMFRNNNKYIEAIIAKQLYLSECSNIILADLYTYYITRENIYPLPAKYYSQLLIENVTFLNPENNLSLIFALRTLLFGNNKIIEPSGTRFYIPDTKELRNNYNPLDLITSFGSQNIIAGIFLTVGPFSEIKVINN